VWWPGEVVSLGMRGAVRFVIDRPCLAVPSSDPLRGVLDAAGGWSDALVCAVCFMPNVAMPMPAMQALATHVMGLYASARDQGNRVQLNRRAPEGRECLASRLGRLGCGR
jgi:hypothetical protein